MKDMGLGDNMNDLNEDYYIYDDNGKYVHVLPVNECLKSLEQRIIDQDGLLQAQKKMISEFNSKTHENEVISQLEKQIDDLKEKLSRSFTIDKRNWGKTVVWMSEHNKKHKDAHVPTAGERYIFEFMPTGIVTCCACRCMLCGEKFEFYVD